MPDYSRQFNFQYSDLVMARVTGVYALTDARKLLVDVAALDHRGSWQKVPVAQPPGQARNYRKGQIVGLLFRHTASNFPMVIDHIHNLETDDKYTDPLPLPYQFIDDQLYYHAETGAFLRFRSATSTSTTGGGDKQPAIVETTLASGASLIIEETDATHARASLLLPSGASIVIDTDGTITATSPIKALVIAPDVELGSDTAKALANAVARHLDLDNIVEQLNAHTHAGVQSGPGVSGPPDAPFTTPPCSDTVFSQ